MAKKYKSMTKKQAEAAKELKKKRETFKILKEYSDRISDDVWLEIQSELWGKEDRMARTYVVYYEGKEVYKGTKDDCEEYTENNYYDDGGMSCFTLMIMLPENIKFNELTEAEKHFMFLDLTLEEREKFNKYLISTYGKE